jgi:hypothetical protein
MRFSSLDFEAKAQTDELKLALNFNPPHIRALDFKNNLKCSKVLRALNFRGEDLNMPLSNN